jgi:Tol biopolymer transport system component
MMFMMLVMSALGIGTLRTTSVISFVAAVAPDYDYHIYALDFPLGIVARLNDQPVLNCCVTWSPEGDQIAFPSIYGSNTTIYVLDWDSLNVKAFPDPKKDYESTWVSGTARLLWSPDGRELAFLSASDSGAQIVALDITSQQRRVIAPGPFNLNIGLSGWSFTDNSILAVLSENTVFGLYLIDAKSGDMSLFHESMGSAGLDLSRDGKQVVAANSEIYTMNIGELEMSRLTTDLNTDVTPVWSPDASAIAFASDGQIWVMQADGSQRRRLTNKGHYDSSPVWSPDGEYILYVKSELIPGLHVVRPDGSGERLLTTSRYRGAMSPAWRP